ncbi:MAG: glycosyltransferase family 4 protein [Propionibacteriaceae bacterium]|nr:glycosyltransferase family 4 protein [Propionibacteriaceae bacterium]
MRVGFFSQWYEPEPGPAALTSVAARALSARGHEVHVLTGFPNYPTGVLADGYRQRAYMREELGGVQVHRVPLYPSHDRSALRRVLNYASFGLSAAAIGVPQLPKLDALWVNYSPITLAFPMWLQQVLHSTPTVCEVGDLWPDTMAVSGLSGSSALTRFGRSVLDRWCNAMYSSSEAVVYISPGVGEILADRGVPRDKLHYIPKSADEETFHPSGTSMREKLGIDEDAVVLVYAGAMGLAQGLGTLIDACRLIDDPRLVVLLAGSGTQEAALREAVSSGGIRNVRFLGRVPHAEMSDLLATADVAFVSLADHPLSAVTMPSKTQSTLAAGCAVLVAATGDVADLVRSNGVGFTARAGDAESIADALRAVLRVGRRGLADIGRTARLVYESQFSLERSTESIEMLLGSVAAEPRRRKLPAIRKGARRG